MAKACKATNAGIRCHDLPEGADPPPGWTRMTDEQCESLGGSRSLSSRIPHTARFAPIALSDPIDEVEESALSAPLELVRIPDGINEGLSSPKNSTMLQILGMPRDHVDNKCRMPTNLPLAELIVTKNVGPFRVTGRKPAVKSLKKIFKKVEKDHPELYSQLGTAGMTCVRYIRNSNRLSNHSWGCAIDVKIGAVLDGIQYPGAGEDGVTLAGLVTLSEYFHKEGWYWGVGFSSFEDGMHFEIADETLRQWRSDGTLGEDVKARSLSKPVLSLGDRGKDVKELQQLLLQKGYDVMVDGHFGPITHAIVIDFQARVGLTPDGLVGEKTMKALLE